MCEPNPKKLQYIRNQYSLKILSLENGYGVVVGCKRYKMPFGTLLEFLADFQFRSVIDEEFLKCRYSVYEVKGDSR
jgi:hypothetical protein